MALQDLNSFEDLRDWVQSRADELQDGTSDFEAETAACLVLAWRDLVRRHPWLGHTKDPPGAFVTVDDITTLTLTISSTGTSVSGTLSAAPANSVSVSGRKIRPSGTDWIARITAHTGGSTSITLDAVPATVAAGTACTIFQDEYTLASDLGLFKDGLWSQDGHFIPLWTEERLRREYPDPPSAAWPPRAFTRLTNRLIRLSHYPDAIRRVEYPYTYVPPDPSGTGALDLDAYLRPVLAELAMHYLYDLKSDRRAPGALARAEAGLARAIAYEERLLRGRGRLSHQAPRGAYGS